MKRLRTWFMGLDGLVQALLVLATAVILAALGVGLWMITGPGPMEFARGQTVALGDYRGPDPTGVPASLKNASLVQRGAYLARAADCVVCHTAQHGTPYAGGFAFTLPFGTIYSPNITPDKGSGIGTYTDAQFLAAVHRGIRDDGERLYPAMPYTSYTYMSDADVLAIKAYLFSLPPVHTVDKENSLSFPFNQRWLMAIWSQFFNADTRFRPNTAQSPQWNRGAYVAEALAHCGECHTPRNLAYALDNRSKFAGALTAGWHAYNITSDKNSGVGGWRADELFAYLTQGHVPGHGTAAGPMGEAVDNSFSSLAPDDMRAVVAYLQSVPAQSSDLPALALPASPSYRDGPHLADARGRMVFEGACASCHDWTGVSPLTPYATLTGARTVNDPSAANVAQAVLLGVRRKTADGTVFMPAFGTSMSDAEIAAVANYVTARFGSQGSHLSPHDVAELRQATAQSPE
jgi:mono/diheme cytochrome c family protein